MPPDLLYSYNTPILERRRCHYNMWLEADTTCWERNTILRQLESSRQLVTAWSRAEPYLRAWAALLEGGCRLETESVGAEHRLHVTITKISFLGMPVKG